MKKNRLKTFLYILVAAVITLGAMVYQRTTGPTYPQKMEVSIKEAAYRLQLIRSHGGTGDCEMEFEIADTSVSGIIFFRKFPTSEEWTRSEMKRKGNFLVAYLPAQPPAGKLEYEVEFRKEGIAYRPKLANATVIRFKGDVPALILRPHIILMFIAMFFANLAGVMAIARNSCFRPFALWTLILMGAGGMIFGPWVQYHAFGEAWTGIPVAWDLTDNKTLIAFLFWIWAVIMNRKQERPGYVILAALVTLAVYSIPHSMYGSQLDPETGKIIQGFINLKMVIF